MTLAGNGVWDCMNTGTGTDDPATSSGTVQTSGTGFTANNAVRFTSTASAQRAMCYRINQDLFVLGDHFNTISFNADNWTGTNNRVYLFDGLAGGPTPSGSGNQAVGVAVRDRQYLEVWTGSVGSGVLNTSIDLVAQINALFPGAGAAAPITGNWTISAGRKYSYTDITSKIQCYITAQVSVVIGGTTYAFEVRQGGDNKTPLALLLPCGFNVDGNGVGFGFDLNASALHTDVWGWGVQNCTFSYAGGTGYSRDLRCVSVVGGNLYQGTLTAQALVPAGSALFNPFQVLSGDCGQGQVFIVDGTRTKVYNASANTVADFVATAGALPAGCRICCIWRDRLVLANQAGSEQALYGSRQGTYGDFNYGQPDAQSAFSLNAANVAGHVGQPIYCVAPVNDDVLLIGCDTSTFALYGDPASGGSLLPVSMEFGVLGQYAWCVDPHGIVFFVGTGGFFRWHPQLRGMWGERALENLSDKKMAPFFAALDRTRVNVFCEYDRDAHGVRIFVSPMDGSQGTHLWWDERAAALGEQAGGGTGFFKLQYPQPCGPSFVTVWDGDAAGDRYVLLGGVDGNVRKIDVAATADDGSAINSYAWLGPQMISDAFDQAMVIGMEFSLGSDGGTVNLNWALNTGSDPLAAFQAGVPQTSGSLNSGGRATRIRARARGNAIAMKLSNSTLNARWSFERLLLQTAAGGQNR